MYYAYFKQCFKKFLWCTSRSPSEGFFFLIFYLFIFFLRLIHAMSLVRSSSAQLLLLSWWEILFYFIFMFLACNLIRLTDWLRGFEGFKLGFLGERYTFRNTEVKSKDGMAPCESGKVNGSIYAVPGSTADPETPLKTFYTSEHIMRNKWDELEALVLSRSVISLVLKEWVSWLECWDGELLGGIGRAGKEELLHCIKEEN